MMYVVCKEYHGTYYTKRCFVHSMYLVRVTRNKSEPKEKYFLFSFYRAVTYTRMYSKPSVPVQVK